MEIFKEGCPRTLTVEEEKTFVQHIVKMAKQGNRYKNREILSLVSDYLHSHGRLDSSKTLSKHWLERMKKRWPELGELNKSSLS